MLTHYLMRSPTSPLIAGESDPGNRAGLHVNHFSLRCSSRDTCCPCCGHAYQVCTCLAISLTSAQTSNFHSTRLTKAEVAYILEHSGSKLILVDSEFAPLVAGASLPTIISNDTGRSGDPYEDFLGKKNPPFTAWGL